MDRETLRVALEHASVPSLVMCLAQITQDPRWLEEPFLPKRDVKLFADESGGLSETAQAQVKEAILDLMEGLETGLLRCPSPPATSSFARMLSTCVGEDVPDDYVPLFMEEFGFESSDARWPDERRPEGAEKFQVAIVGAGVSGLAAAIKLRQLGVPWRLFEKNEELGGTWFENDYPESGVDTPNHFYSFSFAPNYEWTRYFSKRDEVLAYLKRVARDFGVESGIEFRSEVDSMTWNPGAKIWQLGVRRADGSVDIVTANVVITAVGQLNRPKIPALRGLDEFPGRWFHSAQWPENVSLRGQRVGVVGTGASAVQFLRTVAAEAAHVTVFQRSPQWIKPSPDYHRDVEPEVRILFETVPYYYQWYRFGLFWRFADGLLQYLRRDPEWPYPERAVNRANDRHRAQMTEYLIEQLGDRQDLLPSVLPDYPPYGKRILVDNDWYATLKRDNVSLVTSALERLDGKDAVDAAGGRHGLDVLILATGFEAEHLLAPIRISGEGGVTIRDVWGRDDPRAYLGMTVPGFPNLFCLYGPNTNSGHGGSIIFESECQVRYVTKCIAAMVSNGIDSLEVRQDVHDRYNERLEKEHRDLVWTHPGMSTWYRNGAGRVFSIMPWRHVDYWRWTREPDMSDFIQTRAEAAMSS